jgi:hypothetical protein
VPNGYSAHLGGSVELFEQWFAPTDRRDTGSYLPGAASPGGGGMGHQLNRHIITFFPDVSCRIGGNVKHVHSPPLHIKTGPE